MSWSLQEFCRSAVPEDLSNLSDSSLGFLEKLHLQSIHPFCLNESLYHNGMEDIPHMGPLSADLHASLCEKIVTYYYSTVFPSFAFVNLWLRLLSLPVAITTTTLLWIIRQQNQRNQKKSYTLILMLFVLSGVSTATVCMDSMYVLEFGFFGAVLFAASIGISMMIFQEQNMYLGVTFIHMGVLLAFYIMYDQTTNRLLFGNRSDVDIRVHEGLYYSQNNTLIHQLVSIWNPRYREYSWRNGATLWLYSGDGRTGIPYFVNNPPHIKWYRRYLPLYDGEVLALDIVFPRNQSQIHEKPVYLLLHGVNGGTNEAYTRDLIWRRSETGSLVVVMIARGLMSLPMRGWDIFHGARWTDVHAAASAIKSALAPEQVLAGVGFSMGAIVLSNYVASSGSNCALDVAFAISGALDCRQEKHYERAKFTWEPMIANHIRLSQHTTKWANRIHYRLGNENYIKMLRASDIIELDYYMAVKYLGFESLDDFYAEMGALGDIPLNLLHEESTFPSAKIHNVSIPLSILHAFDDPIATWRGVVGNTGFMRPERLVETGQGNLMLLLTNRGGHVGWPLGWFPSKNGWAFQSDAVASFVESYVLRRALVKNIPDSVVRVP